MPSRATLLPRTGLPRSLRASATFPTTKAGMAVFTSPASSMNRVVRPYLRASQVREKGSMGMQWPPSPGPLAPGAERGKSPPAAPRPAGFGDGLDALPCRAGVGGALQHDQLPRPQGGGDGLGGADDEPQVRLAGLRQGGGHADEDRVGL